MMKYRDRLMKKVSFDDENRCRLVLFSLSRGVVLPGGVVLLDEELFCLTRRCRFVRRCRFARRCCFASGGRVSSISLRKMRNC